MSTALITCAPALFQLLTRSGHIHLAAWSSYAPSFLLTAYSSPKRCDFMHLCLASRLGRAAGWPYVFHAARAGNRT